MLITEILNDFQKREIALLPNKDGSGYQFINLDKGHICPGGDSKRGCRNALNRKRFESS